MSNILFRNRVFRELKNFKVPKFFKLVEIPDKDFTKDIDTRIHETINRLNDTTVNSITIPISITENFLEFSGLRLGNHIRLTPDLNFSKAPLVFIGTLEEKQLLKITSLANILLTPNVYYVNLSKYPFKAVEKSIEKLDVSVIESFDLNKYLDRVNIKAPENYEDNHSIANEWAIYRWSQMIEDLCDNEYIDSIIDRQKNNLYFKYLKTIYPPCNLSEFTSNELKLKHKDSRVLYIDDEVEKGWGEIFSSVLGDINNLYFEYLDTDFNTLNQPEIINESIEKVKIFNPDVVILDLRIHKDDFNSGKPSDLTGYKILKEIKKINKGIQVIIFSATNKIWNLQALQSEGADGFIIKEGIENSYDSNFTRNTILNFIKVIDKSLKRKFLKNIFLECNLIYNQILKCDYVDDTPFEIFLNDLQNQLKLISISANNIDLNDSMSLDVVYLNCFNFLEKFKSHFLNLKSYQYILGIQEVEMNRYSIKNGNEGSFTRNNTNDNPSWFHSLSGLFIDYFEISQNTNDIQIKNLNKVKDYRNAYIHGNKKYFSKNDLIMIIELCVKITSQMKE